MPGKLAKTQERKPPDKPVDKSMDVANRKWKAKVKEAAATQGDERKCTGKAFERDKDDQKIKGPDGEFLRRPCRNDAIRGGTVCNFHGGKAPQVKKAAERRLRQMIEPAIDRLDVLMHQNTHLPTALGAISTVLKHTIGDGKTSGGGGTGAPIIKIGVVFGGMATAPTVTHQLEGGSVEGEIVAEDE